MWRSEPIKVEDLQDDYFEYKYIMRSSTNHGYVQRWQEGANNIFDLKRLVLTIKQLNLVPDEAPHGIDARTKLTLESSTSNPRGGDVLILLVTFGDGLFI